MRPGHLQYLARDEVLARAVALHDGGHHVLGHVGVVGQQLLGVLGEAVAAVAERRVVVVRPYPRVEAHPVYDGAGVQALDLGVGVQLVEVAHPESEVRVGEELDGLGLLQPHEQRGDVLLNGPLPEQAGELAGRALQERYVGYGLYRAVLLLKPWAVYRLRYPNDDAAGIQIVIKRLALAQELGGEEQVQPPHATLPVPYVEAAAVAHGDCGLDDHHSVGVHLQHQVDDLLHVGGVEVVPHRVVVRRCGDDHEVGAGVGLPAVEGSRQVEGLLRQVSLDVLVLYR